MKKNYFSRRIIAGTVFLTLAVAVSAPAQNLFEADASGNISEFTPGGVQSTFATGFYDPFSMTVNSAGNLFVGDRINDNIFEVAPDGSQTIFTSVPLSPRALAFNSAGNLFVAGSGRDIYEVIPDGTSSVFGFGVTDVLPNGLAFNSAGDLFAGSRLAPRIYEFSPDGTASIFYTGLLSGTLAFDGNGDLFVGQNSDIYEFVNNNGTLNSTPVLFASGLNSAVALAFDNAGDLFEADSNTGDINEFLNDNGTLSSTPVIFASGLDSPSALAFQVPEPSPLALLAAGTAVLFIRRRKN
jgi:PEP-CTERM motif-containing protein